MNPKTVIPGATLERSDTGSIALDEKRRPIWNKPQPTSKVRHFKNAAKRRKFLNEEISLDEATHEVPVYRGFGVKLFKYLMRGHKRAMRGRWCG